MNTVDLFHESFCILKIRVALISCRWSKVRSKAGENNGLIRPPAESVPGLDNREIAPISSPHGIGVEYQTTLTSPFGSELVGVIWLMPCSGYAVQLASWQLRSNSPKTSVNIWLCTGVTTYRISFNFTDNIHIVHPIHDTGNGLCCSWNMCILTQLLIFTFWSFLRPFFKLEPSNLVQLKH